MIRLILALLLLPTSIAALAAAAQTMGGVAARVDRTLPFLAGFFGYFVLRFYSFRPMRLYVFGHELSHALAAWMSGARVFGFHVGKQSGHVDLSRSNAWIALAPYVLPIYAVGVLLAYRLWIWAAPLGPAWRFPAREVFLLAMGLALSFHLTHTAEAIGMRRQPDLDQAGGIVFSLVCIAAANGLILVAVLKCLFPRLVSMEHAVGLVGGMTAAFWRGAWHGTAALLAAARK